MRLATCCVLFGLLLLSAELDAHHSFAATYFEDRQQSVEGALVQLNYRNPHTMLLLEDKAGVRWAIEWGAGAQLSRQGVSRDTLKYGDHLIIVGSPGRNPADHRLRVRSIVRPRDGWKWSGTYE